MRFFSLLLVLLICIFSACSNEDTTPPVGSVEEVTLGVSAADYSIFLTLVLLAKEKGLFEAQGLNVTIQPYPHGAASLRALMEGQVDLAIGAEFPFVKQHLEGSPSRIIASIAQVDVLQLLARRDSGISQTSDLRGKRIAFIKGTQLEFCLHKFLASHGVAMTDIQSFHRLPPELAPAILQREVDAVVYREPMISNVKAQLQDNWIGWQLQDTQRVFWLLAGHKDHFRQRPEVVKRLLRALLEAESYYTENASKVFELITTRSKIRADVLERMLSGVAYRVSLDQELVIAMEDETRWHMDNRYTDVKEMPNYLEVIEFRGLDAVRPDRVGIIH